MGGALEAPVDERHDVTVSVTPGNSKTETNLYVRRMNDDNCGAPPNIGEASFCYMPVQFGSPGEATRGCP